MSWHAKPAGGYALSSTEGGENAQMIAGEFQARGYTAECQSGIIGNVMGESALNPWRWQNDTYTLGGGYGLFQYTPASSYIDGAVALQHYSPNLSVTGTTAGATPLDGIAQIECFDTDLLQKWVSSCWRSYWSPTTYPALYQTRSRILQTYGSNSRLSMSEFAAIDNVYDATFAFLACFEGPGVPNISERYDFAVAAYEFLQGHPPTPPPLVTRRMPIWMYLRPF